MKDTRKTKAQLIQELADIRNLIHEMKSAACQHESNRDISKESSAVLSSLLAATPAGVALLKDRIFIKVNAALCMITGYSEEEMEGMSTRILYPDEEEFLRVGRNLYAKMEQEGLGVEDAYLKRKNGELIDVQLSLSPFEPKDLSAGVCATVLDITDRKKTEEALRESEEKYRILVENANEMILVAQDGMLKFTNRKGEELLSRTEEEIKAVPFVNFIHPDDRPWVMNAHKRRLTGEILPEVYSFRVIDGAGNVKWVEVNAVLISWEGRPATLNFYTDITKKKLADERIRKSEERYRTIFEHTATANIIVAEDTTILLANSNFESMSGYSRQEVEGKVSWTCFIVPEDIDRMKWYHSLRRVDPDSAPGSYEFRIMNRRKELRNIFMNVAVLPETKESIASMIDITDMIRANERIRKSEERYRTIFENTGNASILADEDTAILLANTDFEKLSGYSKQELEGGMSWTSFVAPEDLEKMKHYHHLRRKGHDDIPNTYEFRFVRRTGEERDILVNIALISGTSETVASLMDITEQKRAVRALKESEERYRTIFENAVEGIFQTTPEGRILSVNPALARMFGLSSPQEMIENTQDIGREIYADPADRERMLEILFREGRLEGFEFETKRRDGTRFWLSINVHLVRDARGKVLYLEGTNMDITNRKQAEGERRRLEEQLLQAQKMESVGRLAGGVAHDFNNMLTPILGYAELLLDDFPPEDQRRNSIEQIIRSAERSRDLVRQLLAFARRQTLEMKPVNLNKVITGFRSMLQRTLHENVKIEIRTADIIGIIQADTGQLEQIIMNLAVNAQDAMPDGGTIIIETSEVVLDDEDARTHGDVATGTYIVMSETDTGTGMDKETLSHLFEPFYTTKVAGKGTGLGLATVYGIVKQHGGHISVYSEPGTGTTFRVYFPRYEGVDAPVLSERVKAKPLHGTETIMVVEDEDQVRNLTVNLLRHYGYTVIEARDGEMAREVLGGYAGAIDLLITDVILPDMNGRMIYEQLSNIRKGLRVLFMSGYSSDVISHHGMLEEGVYFIQKPFTTQDFTRKVRDVIDGG